MGLDCFEILFFKNASGYLLLNQQNITISNHTIVFISPFQKRHWHLDPQDLDFTFLIFQEDFLNDFFSDKLFTYRLIFFYQLDYPLNMAVTEEDMQKACSILTEINTELKQTNWTVSILSVHYFTICCLNLTEIML